jgi:hypothetical protein
MNIAEINKLLSPEGRAEIAKLIERAKTERGAGWIDGIQNDFPVLAWAVDLVANNDADNALAEVQRIYPKMPVWMFGPQLRTFHGWLREEIDKKR